MERLERAGKSRLKTVVRLAVLALVVAGMAFALRKAMADPRVATLDWEHVNRLELVAAGLSYVLGTLPGWWYWHRVLVALGQRPTAYETFRAFQLGQLGKYVPGKAMVVAIRADAVRSERTGAAIAATGVFVETLTAMAVGACWAAVLLVLAPSENWMVPKSRGMIVLALCLMLVAGVPTYPPLFRRAIGWLQVHRADASIHQALQGLNGRLLASGWALQSLAWLAWGGSLFLTLHALPGPTPTLQDGPLITACVALAMVAGFLSLIPGGFGVRELVILTLLAPFGDAKALVSAVVLRMIWLVSESVVAGILYLLPRPSPRQAGIRQTDVSPSTENGEPS